MHGIINRCLELMVADKFGNEFWRLIKREANVVLTGDFLMTEFYSDESTYRLIQAVVKLTGLTVESILELYGEYFFDYIVEFGYVRLLRVLGRNPHEFLNSLDTLHLALARIYPPLMPPLYTCHTNCDGSLSLFYYSKRPNLELIAVGLVRKAIKELFGIPVEVTIQEKNRERHYCMLNIRAIDPSINLSESNSDEDLQTCFQDFLEISLSPATFTELFPYHLIFQRDLTVLQCGLGILRKLPELCAPGQALKDVARISRPHVPLTFEALLEHCESVFLLQFQLTADQTFRLNGQMIYLEQRDLMLYIGSPYVVDLDDMAQKNFRIADLPLHDAKRDFILAAEAFEEERVMLRQLEEMNATLQKTSRLLEKERSKTDHLTFDVLPSPIAKQLKEASLIVPQRFESVTVLFSFVEGFQKYCRTRDKANTGIDAINLLNTVHTCIDDLLNPVEHPESYKVGTVLDTCLVVSGAPQRTLYHAKRTGRFALALMELIRNRFPLDESPINLTIGIDSGEVVAGVIGNCMLRYCLFGATVKMASRAPKSGKKGRINVTESTYKQLQASFNQDRSFQLKYSGEVSMKNVQKPVKLWTLERKHEPIQNFSHVCAIS